MTDSAIFPEITSAGQLETFRQHGRFAITPTPEEINGAKHPI